MTNNFYDNIFAERFEKSLQGNVILDIPFEEAFNDPESQDYKDLEIQLTYSLEETFCSGIPTCSFSITGFKEGSVIVNFIVSVGCDFIDLVNSKMSNTPNTIGGIAVSSGSFIPGKHC